MRATCPICLRKITINERRELRSHNRRKTRKGQEPDPCPGAGRQPLDQTSLPVEVDRG